MSQLIYFIVSYIIVIFIGFVIIQFLTDGFLSKFLFVKISRGKFILVKVFTFSQTYYTYGKVIDEFLTYKERTKEHKRIVVKDRSAVYRAIGVDCIDVNSEKNAIIMPHGPIEGFDAVKFDHLFSRCLNAPRLKTSKENLIFIALIVGIISIAVVAYYLYTLDGNMKYLLSIIQQGAQIR